MTFYELLCGQVPFAGPLEIVIFHTLNTPPPPLRKEHPEIPEELEAICLRALAKKPEDRFPTCRELAVELRKWLASATSPAVPAPTALFQPGSSRSSRSVLTRSDAPRLPSMVVELPSSDEPALHRARGEPPSVPAGCRHGRG